MVGLYRNQHSVLGLCRGELIHVKLVENFNLKFTNFHIISNVYQNDSSTALIRWFTVIALAFDQWKFCFWIEHNQFLSSNCVILIIKRTLNFRVIVAAAFSATAIWSGWFRLVRKNEFNFNVLFLSYYSIIINIFSRSWLCAQRFPRRLYKHQILQRMDRENSQCIASNHPIEAFDANSNRRCNFCTNDILAEHLTLPSASQSRILY